MHNPWHIQERLIPVVFVCPPPPHTYLCSSQYLSAERQCSVHIIIVAHKDLWILNTVGRFESLYKSEGGKLPQLPAPGSSPSHGGSSWYRNGGTIS